MPWAELVALIEHYYPKAVRATCGGHGVNFDVKRPIRALEELRQVTVTRTECRLHAHVVSVDVSE